ncbi:5-aminoimidazole-4-carboxamide ribonucleotide transformylase [Helicobacter enhydrae]|uniref:5-aminoimidazole-4-carboxamide ribonucleotide transformylase n=1 Tax=Helicobacter enhydrae TaxID=222136 RepID=A0A1B1U5K8_9HELI|nr:phosphoribosylaminoimidazolecarboxamide formyltransferase [Helicobacter enhydrae]ANV98046.1 5-aminoimidazole-4-carboxamide ribonucleotide transformylase [Helicobacter enhydrae]
MEEITLKYGCNPNQGRARIYSTKLPFQVLNGNAGYINFLDALNAWQLVKELKNATNTPCATSFKHLSPTSSALASPLSQTELQAYFLQDLDVNASPIATAYARARGADRMSSFGDFIALSDSCDEMTARLIAQEVSDGIIAPHFTQEALNILKTKKNGAYIIIEIDPTFTPPSLEKREVFGITFEQERNEIVLDERVLQDIVTQNKNLPQEAKTDLILSLITLKYTQSNSIVLAHQGQAIGVGAGGQSRIHCTRTACAKADLWHLRKHQKVLELPFLPSLNRPTKDNLIDAYLTHQPAFFDTWQDFFTSKPNHFTQEEQQEYLSKIQGVSLGSDAFFPFVDNLQRAEQSGVSYIAQSGGSKQDTSLIEYCDKHQLLMIFTHCRLFHH